MTNLKFKNVQKLGEKEYMIFLSGSEILSHWKNQDIEYIPEIQRGFKTVKNADGNPVLIPVYSQANVKKIKKSIQSKSFYVSQLTLNILEGADLLFDEETKTLEVENAIIAISDGQHRIRAMEEVDLENQKDGNENVIDLSELIFPIKITNYDKEKAQEQFYQYTLGSKISSSRGEYFNNKDYSNKIVKDLYHNSVLSEKIETVKNIIGKNEMNKVVSFATLKNAIEINFNTNKMDNSSEAEEVSDYLKDFFGELFTVIPEFNDYEERMELKNEQSLKCENFAFYGYVAVAEFLQHKNNWKELLPLITEIDFSKTSPLWASQVTKKNVLKRKSKNQRQEVKYTIINNSQSRREMGVIMVKAFKKILRKNDLLA